MLRSFPAPGETKQIKKSNFAEKREGFCFFFFSGWFSLVFFFCIFSLYFLFFAVKVNYFVKVLEVAL